MSLISNIGMMGQTLRNFQYAIGVNANNVANANTLGYSRESVNFSETLPLSQDGYSFGTGAFVSSIDRVRNVYVDRQIRTQLTSLGYYATRQIYDAQMAAIFPAGGFSTSMNTLSAAWTALALSPTSAAAETAVRDAAQSLATLFNSTSQQLFALQNSLESQIGTTVDQVNRYVDQINTLNLQIKAGTVGNFPPQGLVDAREQAMKELSTLVNAQFAENGSGSVVVSLSGGGTLVDGGGKVNHLTTIPSVTNPGVSDVAIADSWKAPVKVNTFITSGQLGALLTERDTDLRQARLTLDEMASGLIQRTNELNHSGISTLDGTTTAKNFFTGSKASDIRVDANLYTNLDWVMSTRDSSLGLPADIATMQAAQKDFILSSEIASPSNTSAGVPPNGIQAGGALGTRVSPTAALSTLLFSVPLTATSGVLTVSSGGNTVNVAWDNTMSINTIVAAINTAAAGAFYANFDYTDQRVTLISKNSLTVYDSLGSNLAKTFKLGATLYSAAPVNNSPSVGLNMVNAGTAVNNAAMQLDYYTKPVGGTTTVAGYNFTWSVTQSLNTMMANLNAATGAGFKVQATFNSATQLLTLYQASFAPNNLATVANPLVSLTVSDVSGNFSSLTNLRTGQSFSSVFASLMTGLSDTSSMDALLTAQYQSTSDGLQAVQDSISKVDLAQEQAQAAAYQRSYEASVRIQAIMDQMLNVLINHMGSSAPSASTVV